MQGLQTANAPSANTVVPHYILGSFAFLLATILLFISAPDWMGLYFSPKLIGITHILVLGWATMVAFGALYQLIPVVYETSLYSENLAKVTFIIFSISVVFLSYSFWIASFHNLLLYSSLLMFFALLLFVFNLLMTYRKRTKNNIQSKFIITAVLWLAFTEFLGTLTALNFKFSFLTDSHLHYLKIHAHVGLVGWFLMLIIGASSILIPMFIISHQVSTKKLNISYFLINIGLLGLTINWWLVNKPFITLIFAVSIIIGITLYGTYMYQTFRERIRKILDSGLKLSFLAILFLIIPILTSLFLVGFDMSSTSLLNTSLNYGISIIFGLISTLILGQIYKTLPFIVWLQKYQPYVGKHKTLLPKDLYSEKVIQVMMYIYVIGYGLILSGISIQNLIILKIGIILIIITALINFYNTLKISLHQVKLSNL